MRRWMCGMILFALVGCSAERSLPLGEVYREADEGDELTIRSESEVEYATDGKRFLGTYSIEDDGRLRVVLEILGTHQVQYFEIEPEVGLVSEEGQVFYGSEQVQARADNAKAQEETMATLRSVGTAMMAWLTDAVGAAAAGQDIDNWPLISSADLREVLVPAFIAELPLKDGWGNELEYRLNIDNPMAHHVMLVRSPGSDGEFDSNSYPPGAYDANLTTRDIVWGDGYFLTYPEGD